MTGERPLQAELEVLIDEVRRYLVAVDLFRAEGQEPQWTPEWPNPKPALRTRRRREPLALS